MTTGYLPLSRKLFEHPFWKEKREFSRAEAWLDLLQSARFDIAPVQMLAGSQIITFERGELPVSLRYLAERWQWSKNKVDTFLKLLLSQKMVAKRTAPGTAQTILKISNYAVYNPLPVATERPKDFPGTSPGHSGDNRKTPPGRKQDNTNKEKKEKKEKKAITTPFRVSSEKSDGKNNDSDNLYPTSSTGKEKSCAKKESPPLHYPYTSEKFMHAWQQLAQCPKWVKRSPKLLQLALGQLARFEEDFAVLLIESAITGNWQGIIFPDTPLRYEKWKAARLAPAFAYKKRSNFADHDNSKHYEKF